MSKITQKCVWLSQQKPTEANSKLKKQKQLNERVKKVLPKLQDALKGLEDLLCCHSKVARAPAKTMTQVQAAFLHGRSLVGGEPYTAEDVLAVTKATFFFAAFHQHSNRC